MGTDQRRIERSVEDHLGRRLLRNTRQPLLLGLSGGGDSVALALLVDAWARVADRALIMASVDHGLQAQSPDWTRFCARLAARLDRPFRTLSWTGDKPRTGLPAAARDARHRLLADAARATGATTILLGHTADDRLESQDMRKAGSTTPDPREWAPSPVWPEGRGLFILRPLLSIRRRDLRDWLTARGETWIEDPANANLAYARARARRRIDLDRDVAYAAPSPLLLSAQATHLSGVVTLSRPALRQASLADATRFVAMASVCAGGGARRPGADRIRRAVGALRGLEPVTLTLAGARLEGDDREVRVFREAGEAARGGLATVETRVDKSVVWDGRFEIDASDAIHTVRRLAGLAGRLVPDQRDALRAVPAAARGGLPARVGADGRAICLAMTGEARSLVPSRLAAAAGLIDREPDLAMRA